MAKSDPAGEVVTLRTQKVWLREDGILQAENINSLETTLDDAKAIVAACRTLAAGRKRPIYIDTRIAAPVHIDARKYYTSAEVAEVITAIGLLAPSWVARVVGNFVMSHQRKDVAMRLFEGEEAAVAWLADFLR